MNMKPPVSTKITVGASIVAFILMLIPFHAFLTIWASTLVGHYTVLRLWKEILMLPLLILAAFILFKDKYLWSYVRSSWLFILMFAYVLLHILLGAVAFERHQVNASALADALVTNLRLVVFFFIAWVFATRAHWLRKRSSMLLLAPAAVVIVFGLLQAFVLPADILHHVGYGPATIQPYETVDQKLQYIRVQSTLRGANPLGAYLDLVLTASVALVLIKRQKRLYAVLVGLAGVMVMYLTYSRSAYIGFAIAAVALVWLMAKSNSIRRLLLIGGVCICVLGGISALALRHNSRFENTFFHTDQHSQSSQSSNQARSSALEQGIHDVIHEPLGRGPGTAGPASTHNDHPARIAEDYYLQLGQELGWLGLFLFITINVLIAQELWRRRDDWLASVLLASLFGISFVNLLSHAWTDDTLALVWWGLAGIVLAPDILKLREDLSVIHDKAKKKSQ